MTSTSAGVLRHALIAAYLKDLDRALLTADPQERADTVEAVREHIEYRLGEMSDPTSAEIQAILTDLGPVERIAGSATPASQTSAPTDPGTGWLGPVALALAVVAFVLVLLSPFVALALALSVTAFTLVALRRPAARKSWTLKAAAFVATSAAIAAVVVTLGLTSVTTTVDAEPAVPVNAIEG